MNEDIIETREPDVLLEEARAFWRETGKNLIRDSLTAIDNAAKQIIGLAGILEGLYFHSIAFSNLRGTIQNISLLTIYLLPMLLLLTCLLFALLVFFPESYHLNFNSSEASQIVYERLAKDKLRALRVAAIFLVAGIFSFGGSALVYFVN